MIRDQHIFCQKAYVNFLAQKAKVEWVRNGDENTTVFHASHRVRRLQNKINSICDMNGVRVDTTDAGRGPVYNTISNCCGWQ